MTILPYQDTSHRAEVIALWRKVFAYSSPQNEPGLAIDRKVEHHDDLFFVAIEGSRVVGTVLAGYDGHRGWLYSLCVDPQQRQKGIGRALVNHAETALTRLGCIKINLQVMEDNKEATAFWAKMGYQIEPRISLGKLIRANLPPEK